MDGMEFSWNLICQGNLKSIFLNYNKASLNLWCNYFNNPSFEFMRYLNQKASVSKFNFLFFKKKSSHFKYTQNKKNVK